jgi:hypothetical protein
MLLCRKFVKTDGQFLCQCNVKDHCVALLNHSLVNINCKTVGLVKWCGANNIKLPCRNTKDLHMFGRCVFWTLSHHFKEQSSSWEADCHLVNKLPVSYRTKRSITDSKLGCHWLSPDHCTCYLLMINANIFLPSIPLSVNCSIQLMISAQNFLWSPSHTFACCWR